MNDGRRPNDAKPTLNALLTPQVTPQDTPQVTPQVKALIVVIEEEMTREVLQDLLKITDRKYFRKEFVKPALELGLIEMTIPDKPNSRNQRYRLTSKGKHYSEISKH